MPLSQNRASENKFEEPLSSIGAPELKTVLLSLDGAPEYCHNHKKPPQIENTPEVCTAGSRVAMPCTTFMAKKSMGQRRIAGGKVSLSCLWWQRLLVAGTLLHSER